jgi:hypothetical protein
LSYDLADPVPLTINVKDANGALANAGAVTLVITLPDGTVSSPAITNPSAGVYQSTYFPTMAGLHSARWVATGSNASSFADVFDVRAGAPPYITSLSDTKQFLNVSGSTDDEELRGYIEAATVVVENIVGPVVARTIIEVQNPGQVIVLNHAPVISLTSLISVQPGGPTYNVADLDLDPVTGIIRHPIISSIYFWGPLRVTYVAGRRQIPANMTLASRIIIGHLWETQRAQMGRGSSRGGRFGTDEISFSPEIGMAVPRRAVELLDVDRRRPTMA